MVAKKNNGRVLLKLGLVLVLLAAGAAAFFFTTRGTAHVKAVKRDDAVDAVTGTVHVDADGGVKDLKFEVPGRILAYNAVKSAFFKKGDVLAELDPRDLGRLEREAKRKYEDEKARADLVLKDNPEERVAQEMLETAKRLQKLGTMADKEVDAAQRALDAVKKKIELAKFDAAKAQADYEAAVEDFTNTREKMKLVATFDGQVNEELSWAGALIGAGQTVVQVIRNDRVIAAKINEESFGKVKVGQKANLRLLSYGSKTFEAEVTKLHPVADEAQRFTVFLKAKVDPQELAPNSTGEVTITVDRRPNQLSIPRRAIFDGDRVYVVKGGRIERRRIKVGYLALTVAEVQDGLEVGELVITDNLDEFRDGQRVAVEVSK